MGVAFVSATHAELVVVGNCPQADFHTVQAAIDAAEDGDLLELQQCSPLSGFVLDKNVIVFGTNFVTISETITIAGIDGVAALNNIQLNGLVISDCPGTVFVDDCFILSPNDGSRAALVTVDRCANVRLTDNNINPGYSNLGRHSLLVHDSDVQLAAGLGLFGQGGLADLADPGPGGDGLHCVGRSRVSAINTQLQGGAGGSALSRCDPLDPIKAAVGGRGVFVGPRAEVRVREDRAFGGNNGAAMSGGGGGAGAGCECDGDGGSGIFVEGRVRASGYGIFGGGTNNCLDPNGGLPVDGPGIFFEPELGDPTLDSRGVFQRVLAPPGSTVFVIRGRRPIKRQLPQVEGQLLVDPIQILPPAIQPSSGPLVVQTPFAGVPPGSFYGTQALVLYPDGSARLTNANFVYGYP